MIDQKSVIIKHLLTKVTLVNVSNVLIRNTKYISLHNFNTEYFSAYFIAITKLWRLVANIILCINVAEYMNQTICVQIITKNSLSCERGCMKNLALVLIIIIQMGKI